MPVSKTNCKYCGRLVSNSNYNRHEVSCKRLASKKKLTPSERQMSIDPEIRTARAKKANAAKFQKWKEKREHRLKNLPFDDLNIKEKRVKIFEEQQGCCDICNLQQWNGQPITLELDHISGYRVDESRGNLRLICPNCHSQTETYKGKNTSNPGKIRYTDDEIAETLLSEGSLYKTLIKLGLNLHGKNYARLRKIVIERGLSTELLR